MRKVILPLLVAMAAGASTAADVSQPETPGSAASQAYAEALREARLKEGRTAAFHQGEQPAAQAPGSVAAQAAAEAAHLKKPHGIINQSADQRLEFDHPNH